MEPMDATRQEACRPGLARRRWTLPGVSVSLAATSRVTLFVTADEEPIDLTEDLAAIVSLGQEIARSGTSAGAAPSADVVPFAAVELPADLRVHLDGVRVGSVVVVDRIGLALRSALRRLVDDHTA